MSAESWGRRPRDWASLAEPSNHVLFDTVLTRLHLSAGSELLDIGCGSGYAAAMAVARGAVVTGIDITPELLAIARERVPQASFVCGGMDRLPFNDASFDAVVGFNAFQFADNPQRAMNEAARVLRSGGAVAATTFAEARRNQSTALHEALEPLRAPSSPSSDLEAGPPGGVHEAGPPADAHEAGPPAGVHLPYALSAPGGLEQLTGGAGLDVVDAGEVPVTWAHPSADQAVRAVLASGGGAMAIEAAGADAARRALEAAVVAFTAADGSVRMENVFRYVIAQR